MLQEHFKGITGITRTGKSAEVEYHTRFVPVDYLSEPELKQFMFMGNKYEKLPDEYVYKATLQKFDDGWKKVKESLVDIKRP